MIVDKFVQIEQSAQSGAFGMNPLPLPTDKQLESGNYKKGKINLYGLRIAIEQPVNSYRTGINNDGIAWSCRLAANYGYILGTTGSDGDHIDCFIGSYPESDTVYIFNQFIGGEFDEHKIMLCFPDEKIARSAYETSYSIDYIPNYTCITATTGQLKNWLRHGDKSKPLDKTQLPPETKQMKRINWDANGMPIGTDLATILYEIRRQDDGGLLLDATTDYEFNHDYAPFMVNEDILDSLNMPYSMLKRKVTQLGLAFNRYGKTLSLAAATEDLQNPDITKPYKKYGVLMVSAIFSLSDGQTVTIVFHNPDSTPSKIQPEDTMIAWKWILNKKDITVLAAPESGKDLAPMEVAKRIMNLAEKNSPAFQKANKNLADTIKTIDDLSTEINDLGMVLNSKQSELAITQAEYDDWLIQGATNPNVNPVEPVNSSPANFIPTHTYHDSGIGKDVYVMKNEDGNWQSADGMEYVDIDNEVTPVKDDPNFPDYGADLGNGFPEEVVDPVNSKQQTIDPVTLANINASGISAAIKKKAIAYLNANPTTHSFEGSGLSKASQKSIMESIKTALFAEIKALSPLFKEEEFYKAGEVSVLRAEFGSVIKSSPAAGDIYSHEMMIGVNLSNKLMFTVSENGDYRNLFDSTQTLEDLKSWGFALPFDLDVKAFVANVIKPVVDEFLSKQSPVSSGKEYRYAMTNRPVSLSTAPKDFIRVDDRASAGKAHEVYARHGVAIYDRKLTDSETKQYEMAYMVDGDDMIPYAEKVAKEMERYAPQYIEQANDTPQEFAGNVKDYVKSLKDGYPPSIGDVIEFAQMVKEFLSKQVAIKPEPTVTPEPQPPVVKTPINSFDADIEALRGENDYTAFNDKLDELAGKIEDAGLMDQYDSQLNELADLLTELLKKAA